MTVNIPLCVDLDGSLIRSDMLHESSITFAKNSPWHIAAIPGWLMRGKAHLKQKIAAAAEIDVQLLPYNNELLEWLKLERASGRKLILCTASDTKYAHAVAAHLEIFDEVMASNGTTNLSAGNKVAALVARFGEKGFDYVGNSSADLAVWAKANRSIVVGNKNILDKATRVSIVERHIAPTAVTYTRTWMRALRLHQWLKNLLVFLPLMGSHRWLDSSAIVDALLAFASFSLCASAVYVLNDLLDLESDRQHPRKKSRPFAAGTLSIPTGIIASATLFISAFCIATFLGQYFLMWLLVYAVLTTTYSFLLKQFPSN
ncbi:MAG: UbiA family prenyltransferase [Spongiibacteraceae bacterium]